MKTNLKRLFFVCTLVSLSFSLLACSSPYNKVYVRSTTYHNSEKIRKRGEKKRKDNGGDKWTQTFQSATGVPLYVFTDEKGIGAVAVDPSIFPYGSIIKAPGGRKYLAVDTGTAVQRREAARKLAEKLGLEPTSKEAMAPVLDFFSKNQVGKYWDYFWVKPYVEPIPFQELPLPEKMKRVNLASRDL